jgi:hypothetical protein
MSVRPVLLKDLRRTAVHQHQQQVGTGDYNRFSPLVQKPRTFSFGKRKLDADPNDASNAAKTPRFDSTVVFEQLKGQEQVLEEVKAVMAKVDSSPPLDDNCSPQVKEVFGFLGTAVKLLLKSQENLTSVLIDAFKANPAPAAASKGSQEPVAKSSTQVVVEKAAAAETNAVKRVKKAINDAEKKTILFNLDLGNVPTMNRDTLSRKVTLALSSKVSSGNHDYDVKDAEEVMDDILSCSKLEFLGTTTKKFQNDKNPNDTRNGKMCTMPVRFEFKDRDTRIQAETNLRKVCGVSCSVPYPKRLRTILNNLVSEGKKIMPNTFIRTRVNVDSLTVDVHARTGEGWKDLNMRTKIPLNICDAISTETALSQTTLSQPTETEGESMTIS